MKQHRARTKRVRKQPSRRKQHGNPPQIAVGWGRGASGYRPGLFTKQYLVQYGEACAADIFYALKQELKRINKERVEIGDKPIRGCTYNSFAKYWHWFKLLGLVEPIDRNEPSVYDFLERRQFYRLTATGESEEMAWSDPVRTAHAELH